jgi:dTMP kinase
MAKSLFLEGTDGSGKSTQLKLLKNYLDSKQIDSITLREPGGSDYYEALRDFYLKAEHAHPAISDALLSAAGRAANIEQAMQALESKKWVISDRAYPSSYVYQAVQGIPLEDIKQINSYALGGFTYDFKILLDVNVDVAAQRINNTGTKKDYWESQGREFFEKIKEGYQQLAQVENFIIIDANQSIQAIHEELVKIIGI